MYIDDSRKHVKPAPRHTAKHINLCVVVNLIVNLFQKLGPLVETFSSIRDLKEYCELNMFINVDFSQWA